MSVDPFLAHLTTVASTVETALDGVLTAAAQGHVPARLMAAMRHATLGGGKRLRPFLVIEAARLLGGSERSAMLVGCAVECLHVYSLVHDDLPAMDDDDIRRGKPTVHRAFDEATAILVGDCLQTLAFEILADPETHPDAATRAGLVLVLARASGVAGMAGGQMLDLAAEGRFDSGERRDLDVAAIRQLQAMKTGALLAGAVDMGALVGGAAPAARQALQHYGEALGAAFQVADDILDVEASPEDLGKATGKDAGRGKGTLVGALGLDGARAERNRLALAAINALTAFGPGAEVLRAAARFAAERRS